MANDHTFCILLLKDVMKQVRKHTTAKERKDAWTWADHRKHFEFHGPDSHYWYGSAHCKWDARAQGWMAWLGKMGFDNEDRDCERCGGQITMAQDGYRGCETCGHEQRG